MSMIRYEDRCEIQRTERTGIGLGASVSKTFRVGDNGSALYNEYDEPQMRSVYSGRCRYQPQGWNNAEVSVRKSAVYIPRVVVVKKGDRVDVTTADGESWGGTVDTSRVQRMALSGEVVTKVEVIRERES